MNLPILSIIVPVYKTEAYLEACVRSLQAQTLKDWEMVLVDDGSPDGYPAMCDMFADEDSRIRVVHRENGGLSRARNSGIDVAKGKYVAFVDSDDTVDADTYEGNIAFMEAHPEVDVVQFPMNRVGWGDQFRHEPDRYYRGWKELVINNNGDAQIDSTVCMKIFRWELFDKVRFREGHVHEDKWFVLEMFRHIGVLYISGIGRYNYHRRENSIQTTDSLAKTSDWIDVAVLWQNNIYEVDELRREWIGRWMYETRRLMVMQAKHEEWDVRPLMERMRSALPPFTLKTSAKDMFWYWFIRIFGTESFHRVYLKLLKKSN